MIGSIKSINRLFVLSFKNGNNDPTRNSFEKYYMLLVEIKDFNATIDNNPFFDQPQKQEAFEKLIEMSRSDDYTTGNLLDYLHHQKYHKLNTSNPQEINFVGKLVEDDGATMFLIAEKKQKLILNFSLDSLIVTE